jgi:predicted HTH transcriptional regulator
MQYQTLAGFMNAQGGVLLIGVGDNGDVVGLDTDYRTIANGNRDRYESWLTTLFETRLGKPQRPRRQSPLSASKEGDVCRVEVNLSPTPIFVVKDESADLYVRINNSTRVLNTAEAVEYIARHWR